MKTALGHEPIRTAKAYDALLNASYIKVKPHVEEIDLPAIQMICVTGNEPPGSKQYQDAIAVLYGVGYGLKMGLKFGKLPRPKGYFDYRVGALGTFWWSTGKTLEIDNPATLHWKAYLMVPAFVSEKLVGKARRLAGAKHPDFPYERAAPASVEEGRSVQMLHVGPYDKEQPTVAELHRFVAEHGLAVTGRHHEIYISDPRRTKPEKLKTVIRFAVTGAEAPRHSVGEYLRGRPAASPSRGRVAIRSPHANRTAPRRSLAELFGWKAVNSLGDAASDHLPVWADFEWPPQIGADRGGSGL